MQPESSRRSFFRSLFGSAMAAALAQQALAQQPSANGLPTRKLGRTNEQVSILCLGGWHIGAVKDKKEAVRIMHAAIDEGITFFDNAWDYHDGHAEEVMGKALAMDGKRKQGLPDDQELRARLRQGSRSTSTTACAACKTDHLDLWQFHEIGLRQRPGLGLRKRRHEGGARRRRRRARSATSASPATRTRAST